ncbi:MAG: hypothetical protein AAFU77_11670 [Myxococcota bacterium]
MSQAVYDALLRGETRFDAVNLNALGPWSVASRALRAARSGQGAPMPTELGTDLPSGLALLNLCRSAALSEQAAPEIPPALAAAQPLLCRFAEAWNRARCGAPAAMSADDVAAARRAGLAEPVVDAAALVALDQLYGDSLSISDAVHSARSAALRARSEGIAERELFSAVLLARARRLSGKAYLAVQILHELKSVLPHRWTDWFETEWLLAGGAATDLKGPRSRAILGLFRTPGTHAVETLSALGPGRWKPEIDALVMQLGLAEGRDGFFERRPRFGIRDPLARDASWEALVSSDGTVFRRLISGRRDGELEFSSRSRGPRAAQGVLTLAEGGPTGMPLADWFRRVFGFRFLEETHGNLARVTLHRMRKGLPSGCSIERDDDRLRLHLDAPLRVPAAEAQSTIEERVLDCLALGVPTAKAIAASLAVPVRSVQDALKSLVEAGVCEAQKDGRALAYRVEDTTFFAPTLERMRG